MIETGRSPARVRVAPTVKGRPSFFVTWGVAAACSFAISALTYLALGRSLGFDTMNYEFSSGFGLLHGFGSKYALAGQLQTYLDAQVNVFYYLLLRYLPSAVAGLGIVLVESIGVGLLVPVAAAAARQSGFGRATSYLLGGIAGVSGLISPNYVHELGSTFSDTIILLPLLASAGILAVQLLQVGRHFSNLSCELAGACLGVALIVKLTSATCVLGILLGLFVAIALGQQRHGLWTAIRATAITGGVAVAVFIIVYLPTTGLLLWRRYGNPLFPYYNSVFRSRVILPGNWRDTRWTVSSLTQAVHHVHSLLFGGMGLDEYWVRAPILVVGTMFLAALLVFDLLRRRQPVTLFIEMSIVVGFLSWFFQFGYYRYSAVLEMVLPAAVIAAVLLHRLHTHLVVVLLAIVTLLSTLAGSVSFAESDRAPLNGSEFGVTADSHISAVSDRVLLTTGAPMGFLVRYFPNDTKVVRIGGNLVNVMSPLWWREVRAYVTSQGAQWSLVFEAGQENKALSELNLAHLNATVKLCTPIIAVYTLESCAVAIVSPSTG